MTAVAQAYEQERDDHGRFGSGGGGAGQGLPRGNTHAQTEGGGKFQNGTEKEAQVTWAHEKAKEQGRPTYMAPNPGHVPGKPSTGGPFKLSYKPPAKGEYHEVKPDGTMVYHPAQAKTPKAKGAPKGSVIHSRDDRDSADEDFARALAASRPHIAFARAIETAVEGDAPSAARLWRAGWNKTDKGDLNFTPKSAKAVMSSYSERGNPLAWYYEHEDRLPLEKRGGAPMRGVCSAPTSDLAIRDGESGPELWAEHIAWTDEARRQIVTGERRQLSPVAAYDEETREIVEILNVSLCAEGATHSGTLLASRSGKDIGMDDLMAQLQSAAEAGDWETAEDLINQIERLEGGDAMAKTARACVRAAKPALAAPVDAPPDSGKGDVATKRLAASRDAAITSDAFSRGMAKLERATADAEKAAKQSRKATVQTLIAANRDLFDVADEREHMGMADPDATQRHIASLSRKVKTGVVALSKGSETVGGEVKPKKDEPTIKTAEEQLTPGERSAMEQFNRGQKDMKRHLTADDMLRSRTALSTSAPPSGKGAVA